MSLPKLVSKDEMLQEMEKLRAHIADLIRSGRITDGVALASVAMALTDQEWLPRAYVDRKVKILHDASTELMKVSAEVLHQVDEAGKRSGRS